MIACIRYTLASGLNERPSLLTMMDSKKRRAKVDQDLLFATVDVFTDRLFGGNPLAVYPYAEKLTSAQMQQIAREMNYSETTPCCHRMIPNTRPKAASLHPRLSCRLQAIPRRYCSSWLCTQNGFQARFRMGRCVLSNKLA